MKKLAFLFLSVAVFLTSVFTFSPPLYYQVGVTTTDLILKPVDDKNV